MNHTDWIHLAIGIFSTVISFFAGKYQESNKS